MIRWEAFKIEHLQALEARECHEHEPIHEVNTPAVTIFWDDVPLAVIGGVELSPGILQVWARVGTVVPGHALAFYRATKGMLCYFTAKMKLRRVQMSVRCDFPAGRRFAESLGFASEGVMRKYGEDGMDHWLMARVV